MKYVYMYGMILTTVSFVMREGYPKEDSYAEYKTKKRHIGGETGAAAAVLNNLGLPLKIAGPHLGNCNREMIKDYFNKRGVDISELCDEDYDGVEDNVIIAGDTRTCIGQFAYLFSREKPFYEPPCEESVKNCVCCAVDSLGDELCKLAVKYGKRYTTIDCMHDSYSNIHCAVNAVSHEYIDSNYPDMSYDEVMKLYTDNSDGLIIFTLGSKGAMYARKGQKPSYVDGFKVDVVSTLGAGDCFKAGTIYGLFNDFDDEKLVRYACAIAAVACTKYPIPENPPTIEEVEKLVSGGKL